jgi:hypothetical protein
MIGLFPLKQSTASQEVLLGPFLDDTDGKTAETGLTIANTDIKVWKSGGTTEASKNSGGATHIASGRYYAVLDATDTDTLGPLELNIHVAGALPVKLRCIVLTANAYDSLVAGSDALQVDSIQLSGTVQTARDIGASVLLSPGTGTGQLDLSSGAAKGQFRVKKNTALADFTFLMRDSNGDPATGLTVSASRSIDGGASAACDNAVTEIALGRYKISFSAADLNGNTVHILFTATGAKAKDYTFLPEP